MRFTVLLTIVLLASSCVTESAQLPAESDTGTTTPILQPLPSSTPEEAKYPGLTIDQVFPIKEHFSSIDDSGPEAEMSADAAGYTVKIKEYVPRALQKNKTIVFTFKPRREREGYWATLVGVSHLTGADRTEIYTVVSGPGGVCCTNYSIIAVSGEIPTTIYHSEDFGSFRGPMEIFDADQDGVYELVQFDACMRYFLDDCGSCSPEPRVHFKYDRIRREYVPTAGIQQDFVKEEMNRIEKLIGDKSAEFQKTGDLGIKLELVRMTLSYVADLLHVGAEKKAWTIFDKYSGNKMEKTEILSRLAGCKFYRSIRHKH